MLLPWEGDCLEICSDCNAALKGVYVWAEPSSSTLRERGQWNSHTSIVSWDRPSSTESSTTSC